MSEYAEGVHVATCRVAYGDNALIMDIGISEQEPRFLMAMLLTEQLPPGPHGEMRQRYMPALNADTYVNMRELLDAAYAAADRLGCPYERDEFDAEVIACIESNCPDPATP